MTVSTTDHREPQLMRAIEGELVFRRRTEAVPLERIKPCLGRFKQRAEYSLVARLTDAFFVSERMIQYNQRALGGSQLIEPVEQLTLVSLLGCPGEFRPQFLGSIDRKVVNTHMKECAPERKSPFD